MGYSIVSGSRINDDIGMISYVFQFLTYSPLLLCLCPFQQSH